MRWPEKQRHEFIDNTLEKTGFINRAEIVSKFEVTVLTASKDLTNYARLYPEKVTYNLSTKRYERKLK